MENTVSRPSVTPFSNRLRAFYALFARKFSTALPFLGLLVLLQILVIGLFVHPRSAQYTGALAFLTDLGSAIKYLIYFCTALLLALTARLPAVWAGLKAQERPALVRRTMLQLLCYATLLFAAAVLIPNDLFRLSMPVVGYEAPWGALLLLAITATVLSTLLLFAPASYWARLIANEKLAIALAVFFTGGIYFITGIFKNTWDDFLSTPTIALSRFLLELGFADVYANAATKELGVGQFIVLISSTCSGYEGMGMIVAFLTWYSLTFKHDLKYPNALLLFPIAIVTMWIFNCIRIAALIAIGHKLSPDIAMHGFHSNAGWIYFLCVSIGMILIARRLHFFSDKSTGPLIALDADNIWLLPELVLLIATLLTAAWSAGFDWLYPLRVLATGLALIYLWKRVELGSLKPHYAPVAIGIVVFIMWIMLVPPSADASTQFAEGLASVSTLAALAWIAVRIIGATVIVPLAEEFAFRGYLIQLLSKKPQPQAAMAAQASSASTSVAATGHATAAFAWMPLIVSSLCFGALHSHWLAGTLAGIGFGMARYMRGRVWDAVIAHVVANGLLAAYVLSSKHWSYW